jgi:hypothetical protein
MHLRTLLIACLLLAAGCEGIGGIVECHGQNWYRLGLNDGKAGAQKERERYLKSCAADFDAKRYDEGYKAGAGG